jgi:hypothetical protein
LRNLSKKKLKNPSINQCGEKGRGVYIPAGKGRWGREGDYIPVGLKISKPLVPGKKNLLVLILGNPPEKGGEKKP